MAVSVSSKCRDLNEVLEEESLIESIGRNLEDSERANTKSTGEGLGKHDMKFLDMAVSKNRGTPKWMVNIMENPIFLMDDLGVLPFLETSISRDS